MHDATAFANLIPPADGLLRAVHAYDISLLDNIYYFGKATHYFIISAEDVDFGRQKAKVSNAGMVKMTAARVR